MSQLPLASAKNIAVVIRVDAPIEASSKSIRISLDITPPVIAFEDTTLVTNVPLTINRIELPLRSAIVSTIEELIGTSVSTYFDQERKLKTLFNFGDDYQSLLTNWRYDDTDPTKSTILARLYSPLPDGQEGAEGWLVRELARPNIDNAYVYAIADSAGNIYLRPPNTDISVVGITGKQINNVTLNNLLTSSSLDVVKPNDPIINEWYTNDVNSTELNIEYNSFGNFITYGSAVERLNAFKNKLLLIEDLDEQISYNSASLSSAGIFITGTLPYQSVYKLSEQRIEILRTFDAYERFLYYGTGSAYSSSLLTDDYQDELYYMSDVTWPKVNGTLISVESASDATLYNSFTALPASVDDSSWLGSVLNIATEYDRKNPNRLANNVPQFVQDNAESADFIKFFDMVGHHFDNIKPYIDQMTLIYDRQSNPLKGLSPDIIWNVAKSFGVDLPNQYSINTLVDYTIGEIGNVNPTIYRKAAAETWKRFMHNQMFILKSKGTKSALRALLNSYGVLPTTIQIKESSVPSFMHPSGTFEEFEEQTNSIYFNGSSYIQIPFSASTEQIHTIEMRFKPTVTTGSTLITSTGNIFAVKLSPLSGTYGRVEIESASFLSLSSSYLPIFDGDYYSLKVGFANETASLCVQKAEGRDILFSSYAQETDRLKGAWNIPAYIALAGSGSSYPKFTGYVDEFRLWGELISQDTFAKHVKYPGLYNGNTAQSALDYLFVRLSFNIPKNLGSVTLSERFVVNESPYISSGNAPAIMTQFSASGFDNSTTYPYSMNIENRTVLRYTYNAGSQYSTEKTVVVPPPQLYTVTSNNIPVLRRNQSIVTYQDMQSQMQADNVIGFYFSLTDSINDSIIRSIGNVNIQDYIGAPQSIFEKEYSELEQLNKLYWNNYAYTYDVNAFIDFVDNLLDPLFSQARQLVPVRSKLLAGIVHESHILERNKVPEKPLVVSGGPYTRNGLGGMNLSGPAIEPLPTNELVASYVPKSASLGMNDGLSIQSSYLTKNSVISVNSDEVVAGSISNLSASISRNELTTNLVPQYTNYVDVIDLNNEYVLNTKVKLERAGATGSSVFPMISMISNFELPESKMYFSTQNSLVAVPKYIYTRINESILTARGMWTLNQTYNRNDYVSQSIDDTLVEYLCISPDGTFGSTMIPSLDTRNWRRMRYDTIETSEIRQAVLISGSVNFVYTGSAYPKVTGYRPQHFKFTRDNRTGTIRHQWIGCVQTDSTTINGKPVVEVLLSPEATLVVANGSEPISPIDNIGGTILDVQ